MLRELADPRVGDALVKWARRTRRSTGRVRPGTRMAEVGDIRARSTSASAWARPAKLYQQSKFWEADEGGHLSQDRLAARRRGPHARRPRVDAPGGEGQLKADAEESVIAWAKDKPQPHANGAPLPRGLGSEKVAQRHARLGLPQEGAAQGGRSSPPSPPSTRRRRARSATSAG